jgi:uncharacterized protein (DUF1810 family)
VHAQEGTYARALAEIRSGQKQSHWMWYIFPQFDGLGWSATSRRYAIKSLAEARAYLAHPLLGPRLVECTDALLSLQDLTAHDVLGYPDDLKLRSSATLFAQVSPSHSVFHRILDAYFDGRPDEATLRLIEA